MSEQLLLFEIDGRHFALRVVCVREILRCVALTPPVDSSSRLEGVFNLRGQVVPVINLGQALGLNPAEISAADRLVVAEQDGRIWALRVGGGVSIQEVDEAAITKSSFHDLTPESFPLQENVTFVVCPERVERLLSESNATSSTDDGAVE